MTPKYLVINADDFGLDSAVNEAIIELFQIQKISSISLAANGQAFDQAARFAKTFNLDVGIHLTLVGEKPLADTEQIKSLVGSDRHFFKNRYIFLQRYGCGIIRKSEVVHEWSLQFQKIINAGLSISHLDSHQHLHMLPGLFEIALQLGREYHVHFIRLTRFFQPRFNPFKLGVNLCSRIDARLLRKHQTLKSLDRYWGMDQSGRLNKEIWRQFIKQCRPGTQEIMCHPGKRNNVLKKHYQWPFDWEKEYRTQLGLDLQRLLDEERIRLVSYAGLMKGNILS